MPMSDDDIAAIGSRTALRRLPDYLDSDRWNNVEQDLLEFARAIEAQARKEEHARCVRLMQDRAEELKNLGSRTWDWVNDDADWLESNLPPA